MYFNWKATSTNDTDYSCHIKAVELSLTNHMWSISHHIMPLVGNSVQSGHTHPHAQIHTHTYVHMHASTHTHTTFKTTGVPGLILNGSQCLDSCHDSLSPYQPSL